jgi:hypothetical protein
LTFDIKRFFFSPPHTGCPAWRWISLSLSAFLGFVSHLLAKALPEDAGTFGYRLPLSVISPGKLDPAWQTGLPG